MREGRRKQGGRREKKGDGWRFCHLRNIRTTGRFPTELENVTNGPRQQK